MKSWANPGVLISGDLAIVRPCTLGTNTAVCVWRGAISGRFLDGLGWWRWDADPEPGTHSWADVGQLPSEPDAFISSLPFRSVLGKVAPVRQLFGSETFL